MVTHPYICVSFHEVYPLPSIFLMRVWASGVSGRNLVLFHSGVCSFVRSGFSTVHFHLRFPVFSRVTGPIRYTFSGLKIVVGLKLKIVLLR